MFMRAVIGSILSLWMAAAAAWAGERPVVIELYTSQGCSSCPPADAFLAELAQRDDVIALALHVDYWDYIGWKDIFANPGFTARQKAYARAAGARTVYTPQMVIGGVDHVVGLQPMQVADLIAAHRAAPSPVELGVERREGGFVVRARSAKPGPMRVQLVRYLPEKTVQIKRGENSGRTLRYSNIVTEWRALADWDGTAPLELAVQAGGEQPAVVLVQRHGPGRILAAARLR
ncbi:DUF1223 domain-containing protein [Actibacterium sp. MT2.3-13A]|uniref:DUF1223 domain-containing protein n=1 Tax=Actibacterium sp. MT2.3-13A TaxID=2828332 RepID=UPI001BA53574|nr:DUF1223 domain-containing protein [Actibacterium sp. MT2.3-13A]